MCWQEPCGFQPMCCGEPHGIFWKATAFPIVKHFYPPSPNSQKTSNVSKTSCCVYYHLFQAVNRKHLKLQAKHPREQRWRFSLLRLNFPVPSSSHSPAFALLPRSSVSLEIWDHDLTTNLLRDFVRLGQGVRLVHNTALSLAGFSWPEMETPCNIYIYLTI